MSTYSQLIQEWESFTNDNNLPKMCAEELLQSEIKNLKVWQINYIQNFIERWDSQE